MFTFQIFCGTFTFYRKRKLISKKWIMQLEVKELFYGEKMEVYLKFSFLNRLNFKGVVK